MYVFGEIDKSSTIIESNVVNYTQNLNTSSLGLQSIKITSGSINTNYWNSLNVLFYPSGSPVYGNELKFNSSINNYSIKQKTNKQFLSKYHGYPNISLITIPSQYYGEKIKEGSFEFTDVDESNKDNDGNRPIIIDDGFGNLYSTNSHNSQSANSLGITGSRSSSINYVGNIFYDRGIVVLTETGSWSGSVTYPNLATNYNLKFDAQHTITTHEYNVNILPQEYNFTTNYTIRNVVKDSTDSVNLSTTTIDSEFTSSDWQPYITTINLYQKDDYDTPIIQAKLPRPIRKSDKINTRFKIRLDI